MARFVRYLLFFVGIVLGTLVAIPWMRKKHSSVAWHSKQESDRLVDSAVSRSVPPQRLSIHLVTVVFTTTSSETKLQIRQKEHATVLQRNLNHSLISSVHIITASRKEMEEYLRGLDLQNRHKVVVVESNQWDTMQGIFQYISDNLADKDVMYANGDIYLGNGFEKVDVNVLRKKNIFYALSRQGSKRRHVKWRISVVVMFSTLDAMMHSCFIWRSQSRKKPWRC